MKRQAVDIILVSIMFIMGGFIMVNGLMDVAQLIREK
jgi:hypothetical protein